MLALLNTVTSWNGDAATLPVAFSSTEVTRNVSFCGNLWILWFPGCFLKVGLYLSTEYYMMHQHFVNPGKIWELPFVCVCSRVRPLKGLLEELEGGRLLWGWRWYRVCPLCCLASLWELNVALDPLYFANICYINFIIGTLVHNVDHNRHYCPLVTSACLLNRPLLYLRIHYHVIH